MECLALTSLTVSLYSCMQVAKHLTKLFDCMAALEFEKDDKGEVCSKNALSMYSKDGEQVPLAYVCDCDGQVCAAFYTQYLEFLFHKMLIIILIHV